MLIFDKYSIVRRLAVGGMGEIFLARQTGGLDRWVILKSMLPALAADEASVTMFLDEARLAATLSHPNIIAMYEVGRWEGSYFIAMEYLAGENLAVLNRASRDSGALLPLQVIVRIIHDAALALDHAHYSRDARGKLTQIIHRDVSPHNIMVTLEGMTKVVDFGIAKAIERDARTQTQLVRGKLRYMPPEQLLRDPVDGRSDQFALGVVFWELCTGQILFGDSGSDLDVAMALASRPIPKPSTLRHDLPKELDAVIMRMLQRTPSARFPRCLEVAKALAPWLGEYLGAAGTQAVGERVEHLLGARIRERTANAPEAAARGKEKENFLISFDKPTQVLSDREAATSAKKNWLAAAVVFLLSLGVALAVVVALHLRDPDEVVLSSPAAALDAAVILPPPVEEKPEPVKSPAMVRLNSTPSGARVYTGTKPLGETPLEVELEPKVMHTLVLKKDGFAELSTAVVLQVGESKNLEVALAPLQPEKEERPRGPRPRIEPRPVDKPDAGVSSAPVAEGPGYLSVDSNPWSQVIIDGKPLGFTPLFKLELKPGKYIVHFVNPEAKIDEKREVVIRSGAISKVSR